MQNMIKKVVPMSLVATAGMTLYSYLVSRHKKEKFLETLLLNQLVYPHEKRQRAHHKTGYLLHYLVGLFFSTFYDQVWKHNLVKPGIFNSSWMGFLNGIGGIAGWHLTFTLHQHPPKVKLKRFYGQLLLAHVIFGILNGWTYRRLKHK
jgi:hypothetical protein